MTEIDLQYDGDLAVITLNRPRRKNSLTAANWTALTEAVRSVTRGPARAVLLRGKGGDFSAGFDISEIKPDKADALALIDGAVNPALRALRDIPVPTIAATEGACVGGGLGLAASCDVVLASETSRFSVPYANIGIMADAGLHVFLRETLGHQMAMHLILSGQLLSAEEGRTLGLCAQVLPAEGFDAAARAYATRIAAGPTQAFRRSKTILRTVTDPEAGLNAEARFQDEVFATDDAREGIAAFLEGRKPQFTGH